MRGRQFIHFNGRINAEKFTTVLFYMYDFLFVTIATIYTLAERSSLWKQMITADFCGDC